MPDNTQILGQLLWLASIGGSQNPATGAWSVNAMDEAAYFARSGDLPSIVASWVCRFYKPEAIVFHDQHLERLTNTRQPLVVGSVGQALAPPQEIAMSVDHLRSQFPDANKLGFLIMQFTPTPPFARIVDVIKKTASNHGLVVLRADEVEFHSDLWGNVRTLLHGCGFGIAVHERIRSDEPNANVGLEIGYLMAMNKPVLLLKDDTVEVLQSDLRGKLYKTFDAHAPETDKGHH